MRIRFNKLLIVLLCAAETRGESLGFYGDLLFGIQQQAVVKQYVEAIGLHIKAPVLTVKHVSMSGMRKKGASEGLNPNPPASASKTSGAMQIPPVVPALAVPILVAENPPVSAVVGHLSRSSSVHDSVKRSLSPAESSNQVETPDISEDDGAASHRSASGAAMVAEAALGPKVDIYSVTEANEHGLDDHLVLDDMPPVLPVVRQIFGNNLQSKIGSNSVSVSSSESALSSDDEEDSVPKPVHVSTMPVRASNAANPEMSEAPTVAVARHAHTDAAVAATESERTPNGNGHIRAAHGLGSAHASTPPPRARARATLPASASDLSVQSRLVSATRPRVGVIESSDAANSLYQQREAAVKPSANPDTVTTDEMPTAAAVLLNGEEEFKLSAFKAPTIEHKVDVVGRVARSDIQQNVGNVSVLEERLVVEQLAISGSENEERGVIASAEASNYNHLNYAKLLGRLSLQEAEQRSVIFQAQSAENRAHLMQGMHLQAFAQKVLLFKSFGNEQYGRYRNIVQAHEQTARAGLISSFVSGVCGRYMGVLFAAEPIARNHLIATGYWPSFNIFLGVKETLARKSITKEASLVPGFIFDFLSGSEGVARRAIYTSEGEEVGRLESSAAQLKANNFFAVCVNELFIAENSLRDDSVEEESAARKMLLAAHDAEMFGHLARLEDARTEDLARQAIKGEENTAFGVLHAKIINNLFVLRLKEVSLAEDSAREAKVAEEAVESKILSESNSYYCEYAKLLMQNGAAWFADYYGEHFKQLLLVEDSARGAAVAEEALESKPLFGLVRYYIASSLLFTQYADQFVGVYNAGVFSTSQTALLNAEISARNGLYAQEAARRNPTILNFNFGMISIQEHAMRAQLMAMNDQQKLAILLNMLSFSEQGVRHMLIKQQLGFYFTQAVISVPYDQEFNRALLRKAEENTFSNIQLQREELNWRCIELARYWQTVMSSVKGHFIMTETKTREQIEDSEWAVRALAEEGLHAKLSALKDAYVPAGLASVEASDDVPGANAARALAFEEDDDVTSATASSTYWTESSTVSSTVSTARTVASNSALPEGAASAFKSMLSPRTRERNEAVKRGIQDVSHLLEDTSSDSDTESSTSSNGSSSSECSKHSNNGAVDGSPQVPRLPVQAVVSSTPSVPPVVSARTARIVDSVLGCGRSASAGSVQQSAQQTVTPRTAAAIDAVIGSSSKKKAATPSRPGQIEWITSGSGSVSKAASPAAKPSPVSKLPFSRLHSAPVAPTVGSNPMDSRDVYEPTPTGTSRTDCTDALLTHRTMTSEEGVRSGNGSARSSLVRKAGSAGGHSVLYVSPSTLKQFDSTPVRVAPSTALSSDSSEKRSNGIGGVKLRAKPYSVPQTIEELKGVPHIPISAGGRSSESAVSASTFSAPEGPYSARSGIAIAVPVASASQHHSEDVENRAATAYNLAQLDGEWQEYKYASMTPGRSDSKERSASLGAKSASPSPQRPLTQQPPAAIKAETPPAKGAAPDSLVATLPPKGSATTPQAGAHALPKAPAITSGKRSAQSSAVKPGTATPRVQSGAQSVTSTPAAHTPVVDFSPNSKAEMAKENINTFKELFREAWIEEMRDYCADVTSKRAVMRVVKMSDHDFKQMLESRNVAEFESRISYYSAVGIVDLFKKGAQDRLSVFMTEIEAAKLDLPADYASPSTRTSREGSRGSSLAASPKSALKKSGGKAVARNLMLDESSAKELIGDHYLKYLELQKSEKAAREELEDACLADEQRVNEEALESIESSIRSRSTSQASSVGSSFASKGNFEPLASNTKQKLHSAPLPSIPGKKTVNRALPALPQTAEAQRSSHLIKSLAEAGASPNTISKVLKQSKLPPPPLPPRNVASTGGGSPRSKKRAQEQADAAARMAYMQSQLEAASSSSTQPRQGSQPKAASPKKGTGNIVLGASIVGAAQPRPNAATVAGSSQPKPTNVGGGRLGALASQLGNGKK